MRTFTLAYALTCLAACAHGPGARSTTPQRGLWIGSIQICRDTAESAVASTGEDILHPAVIVTLKPEQRVRLQAETERLVGSTMPVRLNGRVILEPHVTEPITGGAIALSGALNEGTEAIQAAIRQPC